ncbi:TPA: hypothetical protein ACMV0S_004337, partial [Salmonella enterica subsp. enterica]
FGGVIIVFLHKCTLSLLLISTDWRNSSHLSHRLRINRVVLQENEKPIKKGDGVPDGAVLISPVG